MMHVLIATHRRTNEPEYRAVYGPLSSDDCSSLLRILANRSDVMGIRVQPYEEENK
jgi:hypothetical protein